MAYPGVHKLPVLHETCYMIDMSSATATSNSAYLRAPSRSRISKLTVVQNAAVTVASAVITMKINSTQITGTSDDTTATANVITIDTARLAGAVCTFTPDNASNSAICADNDVISFVSNHGSTTACPATCEVTFVTL
jgi:hypothetical protein